MSFCWIINIYWLICKLIFRATSYIFSSTALHSTMYLLCNGSGLRQGRMDAFSICNRWVYYTYDSKSDHVVPSAVVEAGKWDAKANFVTGRVLLSLELLRVISKELYALLDGVKALRWFEGNKSENNVGPSVNFIESAQLLKAMLGINGVSYVYHFFCVIGLWSSLGGVFSIFKTFVIWKAWKCLVRLQESVILLFGC